jgi:hypothetical protein
LDLKARDRSPVRATHIIPIRYFILDPEVFTDIAMRAGTWDVLGEVSDATVTEVNGSGNIEEGLSRITGSDGSQLRIEAWRFFVDPAFHDIDPMFGGVPRSEELGTLTLAPLEDGSVILMEFTEFANPVNLDGEAPEAFYVPATRSC